MPDGDVTPMYASWDGSIIVGEELSPTGERQVFFGTRRTAGAACVTC